MISLRTGAVSFTNGLEISAHADVFEVASSYAGKGEICSRMLPASDWLQWTFGIHFSDRGSFQLLIDCSGKFVQRILLSHEHSFYGVQVSKDRERRIFHESIIATDLRGQCEFEWGDVSCEFDAQTGRDWLVISYDTFSKVPLHPVQVERTLWAHEEFPE